MRFMSLYKEFFTIASRSASVGKSAAPSASFMGVPDVGWSVGGAWRSLRWIIQIIRRCGVRLFLLGVERGAAAMRIGAVAPQRKMAEGAARFRPTLATLAARSQL
jgi:hypothetical protein